MKIDTTINILEIKEAVKKNDIKTALDELEKINKSSNLITLLQARLSALKDEKNRGIIENNTFQIGMNQIVNSILEIIEEEEEKLIRNEKRTIQISKNRSELKKVIENIFINEYEILDEISNSKNHRSVIYKARSRNHQNLYYAIKVYKVFSLIEEENNNELHYSMKNVDRTSKHEGIVDIIKVNKEYYPWFIIMEYIEGGSLNDFIKGGWMIWQIEEVIDILRSIINSVWNCHQEGIVHGNLRPQNVLFNKNANNKPIISPFSILRNSFFSRRTFDTTIERCKYLSPEEMDGHQPDEKSDQFSIGLLGVELITGKSLYKGNSVVEIINERNKHIKDSNYVANILKDCPKELALIIGKMLEPTIDNRYEDLYEVLADLKKIIGKKDYISTNDLRSIRLSYDRCRKKNNFILEFYNDFFIQCPNAKDKFSNIDNQYKMLDMAIDRLIKLQGSIKNEAIIKRFKELGHFHQKFNIENKEYEVFKSTLLEKLKKYDSKKWNSNLEQAWDKLLDKAVSTMKT